MLINFFGIKILTDPVLFPRIGIRLPGFTIGPKRLIAPALEFHQLPQIDVVLLSHAHFDHLDLRTLHCFDETTSVITARETSDLLRRTRFSDMTELHWRETKTLTLPPVRSIIIAFPVKHWGARKQRDTYRGYNGYFMERNGRRIIFAGDTAMTESFAELRRQGPSISPSCRSARTIPGSDRIARPSRQSRWQTLPARDLSCRCIIKLSGSVLSHCANRSNASKPR